MSDERLEIPHPAGAPNIVGILHRTPSAANSSTSSPSKPLVLIIHGQLAHKNQSYHRRLASSLSEERGWSSYRYDLRGQGGETEAITEWTSAGYEADVDDLQLVVDWFVNEGYTITLIVGHSRGSAVSSYFLSNCPQPSIPLFANVSGRYDMTRIAQNKVFNAGFAKYGYHDWHVKVAGKAVVRRVTPEGAKAFAEWDNSYLIKSFPQDIHVLTCHGEADQVVPVADAYLFDKILSQRSPGTHTLRIIPGESHNWTRPWDEPVTSILQWLDEVNPKCLEKPTAPSAARL